MSNIHSLLDQDAKKESAKDRLLSLFTGGQKSGLAVEAPQSAYTPLEQSSNPASSQSGDLFTGIGHSIGESGSIREVTEIATTEKSDYQYEINPDEPTTTIQFRLTDGSVVQQKFNTCQTVNDLHLFLQKRNPKTSSYKLLFGFPPKPISEDKSLTLTDAGLLNETLTQKLS